MRMMTIDEFDRQAEEAKRAAAPDVQRLATMLLNQYLDRASAAAGDDRRLTALLHDMEQQYDMPMLAVHLPVWEKRTPGAKAILAVYRGIAGMRT